MHEFREQYIIAIDYPLITWQRERAALNWVKQGLMSTVDAVGKDR